MDNRPNILIIMTDQQSATMMGCSGNAMVSTPYLDALARRGVRFTRAYCANPVCIPSRFSIFTGRMPEDMGLRSNDYIYLPPCPENILEKGMGHLFANAGYNTYYGGKQHFPGFSAHDIGFDVVTLDEREGLAEQYRKFFSKPQKQSWLSVASFINPHDICYKAICDFIESEEDLDKIKRYAPVEYKTMKRYDKIPQGISWSDFFDKHCPPLPENFMPQSDEPEIIEEFKDQRPFKRNASDNYTNENWRMHRYIYKRLTELADSQIGIVLDALDKSGQKDNTLVIFTSDHGDMDSAHHLEHKTVFYEEAVNIPMIIAWPGHIPENTIYDKVVSNGLDILPTILNAAGIDIPGHLKGHSLLPTIMDVNQSAREYVPIESEIGRAIVTDEYKYALYDYGKNNEQLYIYTNDRGEMHNHINDEDCFDQVENLKTIFKKEWSDETRAMHPTPMFRLMRKTKKKMT